MEACWCESDRDGLLTSAVGFSFLQAPRRGRRRPPRLLALPPVVVFSLCRRDVADWLEQTVVIEPCNPGQGCQFDRFLGLPRAAAMDHLGLVQAIDRLGQRVVVAVALAANRRFDAGLCQSLGVAN